MNLVPEWAPNLHPMLVHFPIVLFIFALLFEVIGLFYKKTAWRNSALLLYGFGLAAVVAVYVSGRQAANIVSVPDSVLPAISAHADWGARTLWFWVAFSVVRLALAFAGWDKKRLVLGLLVAGAVAGNVLVYETAEHGARLVYGFGVGVKSATPSPDSAATAGLPAGEFQVTGEEVLWKIGSGALTTVQNRLRWFPVPRERVQLQLLRENDRPELAIRLQNARAALLVPFRFENLSLEAELNADEFQGELLLVHHVADTSRYSFLAIRTNGLFLGHQLNDVIRKLNEKTVHFSGWHRFKVVGTAGHFRGYLDGQMLVHGHGEELSPGSAGLILRGTGVVKIRELKITKLESNH